MLHAYNTVPCLHTLNPEGNFQAHHKHFLFTFQPFLLTATQKVLFAIAETACTSKLGEEAGHQDFHSDKKKGN